MNAFLPAGKVSSSVCLWTPVSVSYMPVCHERLPWMARSLYNMSFQPKIKFKVRLSSPLPSLQSFPSLWEAVLEVSHVLEFVVPWFLSMWWYSGLLHQGPGFLRCFSTEPPVGQREGSSLGDLEPQVALLIFKCIFFPYWLSPLSLVNSRATLLVLPSFPISITMKLLQSGNNSLLSKLTGLLME